MTTADPMLNARREALNRARTLLDTRLRHWSVKTEGPEQVKAVAEALQAFLTAERHYQDRLEDVVGRLLANS